LSYIRASSDCASPSNPAENYEEIVKTVFAYLRLLVDAPSATQAQTFDECATLASLSFRFAEKSSSPADDASDLASQLSGPWPKDWTLSQQYLMREFDERQVRDVIARLADISKVKGLLAGQKLPTSMAGRSWDQKEKVYGTEYLVERFSEDLVKAVRLSVGHFCLSNV
jgi:insulysin